LQFLRHCFPRAAVTAWRQFVSARTAWQVASGYQIAAAWSMANSESLLAQI